MQLTIEILFSFGAILIAVSGLIYQHFGTIMKLKKELQDDLGKIAKKLSELEVKAESRLIALETKIDLFWNFVQKEVTGLLKQPVHMRKDELLEKFKEDEISVEDLKELKTILKTEMNERNKDDPKIMQYVLVVASIDQSLFRRGEIK